MSPWYNTIHIIILCVWKKFHRFLRSRKSDAQLIYSCADEGERRQFTIYIMWLKERAFFTSFFFSSRMVLAFFFPFVSVYYDSVASQLQQYTRARGPCCMRYCVYRWQPRRSLSTRRRPKVRLYCYWIFKSERTEYWIIGFVLIRFFFTLFLPTIINTIHNSAAVTCMRRINRDFM